MRVIHFDSVDSTNEAAKRLIRNGELSEPAYLLAREQTAGKGSRGRAWLSPKDAGIYLTVVELPRGRCHAPTTDFTLAVGVACAEALEEAAGIDVRLKPVNDLYVDGCKLGGILTETMIQNGSVEALIMGVGINVRIADRPVADDAARPVCVEELLPADRFDRFDANTLTALLVVKIRAWTALLTSGETARVKEAWEGRRLSAGPLQYG